MSKAIEQIVGAYVKLGNHVSLENLRMHRQMLAVDLKGRATTRELETRLPPRTILRRQRPCAFPGVNS
jgi:hypothetical protein